MKQKSKLAKGRFTGDPSYEFEHIEMKKVGDGDDQTEEEETASIFALLGQSMMTQCTMLLIISVLNEFVF